MGSQTRRTRGLSISFRSSEADWITSLVHVLEAEGYPKATRSEVIRTAVLDLQNALSSRSRADIVKYFGQRAADASPASRRAIPGIDGGSPAIVARRPGWGRQR